MSAQELWVCPWGICNTKQAQECRAAKGTTKRGCGTRFPATMTSEEARESIQLAPLASEQAPQDRIDAQRWREFCSILPGLSITYEGEEYTDLASLNAALDAKKGTP